MTSYRIIYADPPWQYRDNKRSGSAQNHYLTTSTNDLCFLDIPRVTAKDAVLIMWVTYPQLPEALKLFKAWGFIYKTGAFTWVKQNKKADSLFLGMGHHTRSNAEICLLGVKGKGVPRVDATIRNTQIHRIGRHSEKPLAFREDIEKLYGITPENSHEYPRLEMFARYAAPGWDVFGDQAPNSIDLPVRAPVTDHEKEREVDR